MRNFILALVTFALAATMLAGCGNEPPTVGAATDFAAVCARENDGKRVAVDGYLSFPDSFTDSQSVVLRLHETDDSATRIGVQIRFGKEPNQVEEVADQFSDDDLRVHLADGTVSGFGEKVTVSGKVYFPVVDQAFACALENPLVEQPD